MSAAVPESARPLLDRHFGAAWHGATVMEVAGTANFVCHLSIGREAFALRVPRISDGVARVDRASELAAQHTAAGAGLAPEVVASDESAGILVTRWMAGDVWSYQRAREDEAIVAIASLFRKLHGLPSAGVRRIRIEKLIEDYAAQLAGMGGEAADACHALRAVADERIASVGDARPVLCHNDVHHRNVVQAGHFARSSLCLLDWEYSGYGPAAFDLAGYASYHDLDDRAVSILLNSYSGGVTSPTFAHWCWLFDYVRALWGTVTASTGGVGDPLPVLKRLLSAH